AQRPAVEQDGLEVHPRGVQTGGQAGGAPADDDDVVLAHAVTGIVTALARIPRTTIAGPAGLAQAELRSEAAARRVADDVVERAADRAGAAFDAVAEAHEVLLLLLVPLVHAGRAEVVAVLAGALGRADGLIADLDVRAARVLDVLDREQLVGQLLLAHPAPKRSHKRHIRRTVFR